MFSLKRNVLKFFSFFCFILINFITFPLSASGDSSLTNIVIVSTNDPDQADYWQTILNELSTQNLKYIVVYEDWPDGADNGLGSLYAFTKANKQAQERLKIDLKELLSKGGGISLFHCAGVGKRLYPLTASENNNKSAVKIPGKAGTQPILELVLEQTISHTKLLNGRLSVFWGDQIFVPSEKLSSPKNHVEIFAMAGNFPSEEDWTAKNLNQYGLIIQNNSQSKLVEKTTYANLLAMVPPKDRALSENSVAVSLGSFSISAVMLEELLTTFNKELSNKTGKLNTDYHFWMPLTWSKEAYCEFMATKGASQAEVMDIYERMQGVKKRLSIDNSMPLFGVQNVGEKALWLDFGSIKAYYKNLMALLSLDDAVSNKLVSLFGVDKAKYYHPENNALIINCDINDLNVSNSILINVKANKVAAKECIIINSSCNHVEANHALIYNAKDEKNLALQTGEVRADVFLKQGSNQVVVYSTLYQDNKEEWNVVLPKNDYSFEEIYRFNENRSGNKKTNE